VALPEAKQIQEFALRCCAALRSGLEPWTALLTATGLSEAQVVGDPAGSFGSGALAGLNVGSEGDGRVRVS